MIARASSTATVTAADGTSIRYRQWPAAQDAPRIVLIHSLAMDGGFWQDVAEHLSDWQIIAVDCRGHGDSDKPDGPYTVDLFADDVAAVLDDADWTKAAVAGASMGGCVALAFAARHAHRMTGLGLIDTTAYYGEGAEAAWEERGQKALHEGFDALVGFQQTRWFSDKFRESSVAKVQSAVDVFRANDPAAYLETCRMLGRADLRTALPDISVPVEIVVGEEDYATPPEMASAMASAIPTATMTVLDGVRHFTPLEVPAKVAECLARLSAVQGGRRDGNTSK